MKKMTKRKAILMFLILLLGIFGIYAGIDQIIFQSRKTEYVAAVKQYVNDVIAANNITKDEEKNGADCIVANQKKKMNILCKKYFKSSKSDLTSLYMKTLEKDIASGWKWHGVQVSNMKEITAWKSPFQQKAHVTLSYSVTIPCDSVGAVWYAGDIEEVKVKNGQHTIQNYYNNEYTVSGWKQMCIECVATRGGNQKEFLK